MAYGTDGKFPDAVSAPVCREDGVVTPFEVALDIFAGDEITGEGACIELEGATFGDVDVEGDVFDRPWPDFDGVDGHLFTGKGAAEEELGAGGRKI